MLRALQRGVLALVFAAIGVAAADAQTAPPGTCNGGPFTLTAGEVKFHVALDDRLSAPSMKVTLRIYDADGTIVASTPKPVNVAPGKTTTLEFRGSGLFRVQATFDRLLSPGDRRETVSSVELLDADNFKAVIPVKCLPNHPIVE